MLSRMKEIWLWDNLVVFVFCFFHQTKIRSKGWEVDKRLEKEGIWRWNNDDNWELGQTAFFSFCESFSGFKTNYSPDVYVSMGWYPIALLLVTNQWVSSELWILFQLVSAFLSCYNKSGRKKEVRLKVNVSASVSDKIIAIRGRRI